MSSEIGQSQEDYKPRSYPWERFGATAVRRLLAASAAGSLALGLTACNPTETPSGCVAYSQSGKIVKIPKNYGTFQNVPVTFIWKKHKEDDKTVPEHQYTKKGELALNGHTYELSNLQELGITDADQLGTLKSIKGINLVDKIVLPKAINHETRVIEETAACFWFDAKDENSLAYVPTS